MLAEGCEHSLSRTGRAVARGKHPGYHGRMDSSLFEGHEDATVVPKGHGAILISPEGECILVTPHWSEEEEVPDVFLAMTMAALKFMRDPEWVEELAQEFKDSPRD